MQASCRALSPSPTKCGSGTPRRMLRRRWVRVHARWARPPPRPPPSARPNGAGSTRGVAATTAASATATLSRSGARSLLRCCATRTCARWYVASATPSSSPTAAKSTRTASAATASSAMATERSRLCPRSCRRSLVRILWRSHAVTSTRWPSPPVVTSSPGARAPSASSG